MSDYISLLCIKLIRTCFTLLFSSQLIVPETVLQWDNKNDINQHYSDSIGYKWSAVKMLGLLTWSLAVQDSSTAWWGELPFLHCPLELNTTKQGKLLSFYRRQSWAVGPWLLLFQLRFWNKMAKLFYLGVNCAHCPLHPTDRLKI